MYRAEPTWSAEEDLWAHGLRHLAGLDEAGRGAWAGPVVAAAVILPPPDSNPLSFLRELRDSKQLTPTQRERLYAELSRWALGIGVGRAEAQEIDTIVSAAHIHDLGKVAIPDGILQKPGRLTELEAKEIIVAVGARARDLPFA